MVCGRLSIAEFSGLNCEIAVKMAFLKKNKNKLKYCEGQSVK